MIGKRVLISRSTGQPKFLGKTAKGQSPMLAKSHIVMVNGEAVVTTYPKAFLTGGKREKGNPKVKAPRHRKYGFISRAVEYDPMIREEQEPIGRIIGNTIGNLLDDVARKNPAIKRDLTLLANTREVALEKFVEKMVAALKFAVPGKKSEAVESPIEPAAVAEKPDLLQKARTRGMELKLKLFNSDEMYQADQVAGLLGVSTARVCQMATEKRLFSLRHPVNRTHVRYPAWQLEDGVRDALPVLLKTLDGLDGWTIRHFFTTGDSCLRGLTPLQVLQEKANDDADKARLAELLSQKKAVDLVKEAAEDYKSGGC